MLLSKKTFSMGKIMILSLFALLLISGCSANIPLSKNDKNAKKSLNQEEARAVAEKFINENLLPPSLKANIKTVALEGDVYNINLEVDGKDYISYMTKDGEKFFQSGMDMAKFAAENAANRQAVAGEEEQNKVIPKTDKPKVELFVMTHCPYGLQAEKGIMPAFETLGNKIDAKVRFVHYFMHGDKEEQETYNQVCLREEQPAKYASYLKCFAAEGDSSKCAAQIGIDNNKLANCLKGKAKDYYKADSNLSNAYGVGGSPTLVINGVQSQAGRDSANYLAAVCAAFNKAPAECSEQLSSAQPAPGFGSGTDNSGSNAAGCGQ